MSAVLHSSILSPQVTKGRLSGDPISKMNQTVNVGGFTSLSVVQRLYYPKNQLFDFENIMSAGNFCVHLSS